MDIKILNQRRILFSALHCFSAYIKQLYEVYISPFYDNLLFAPKPDLMCQGDVYKYLIVKLVYIRLASSYSLNGFLNRTPSSDSSVKWTSDTI